MSSTDGSVSLDDRGSSAPARSRAATRQRIVESATELFAAEGLHSVSSARIAKAAGVAAGTFYLHFRDKKQLFREIVFAALGRLHEAQDRASEVAGPELDEQVGARVAALCGFAEENRSLIMLVFGRDHEAASLDEDVLDALRPGTEHLLKSRVESGALPASLNIAVASQALLGMQSRVIVWWLEDPSRATRADVIDALCRMHPLLHLGEKGERGEDT
jgi:AcrR family transcriptional regulator